ncbi:ankyrin repeat domain-containing protein [Rickettsiales endosymbiont of Stachyamoeba lipophora]|uniref:ankyrin repeat domain-containing protein n=1 Tax=Rickettsiales endosymbiont of Stachyamoeba lipophora TaxID=2486578 RepID=UPI000F646E4D|nr:ankyrin repeat domain-containing protein [Rickettsiales endosymbiont of Stachyamoeba lipophora]AZL16091.1 ankyrin repeat domain-containing protein [Rickettsiales endosymbiont of Stachyamoeba lipophora]
MKELTPKDRELIHAVWKKDLNKAKTLIEQGANVDLEDLGGITLLHYAVGKQSIDIIEFLLSKNKIDINKQKETYDRETALMIATRFKNKKIMELLLAKGAKVNIKDKYGDTALYCAVSKDFIYGAKLLLEHKADMTISNNWNMTSIHKAVISNNKEMLEVLLASLKDYNILTKILDQKATLSNHQFDEEGEDMAGEFTPLEAAAMEGYLELIPILMKYYPAEINKDDPKLSSLEALYTEYHSSEDKIDEFRTAIEKGIEDQHARINAAQEAKISNGEQHKSKQKTLGKREKDVSIDDNPAYKKHKTNYGRYTRKYNKQSSEQQTKSYKGK